MAVDYSRTSGADALIVVCGPPAANHRLTGNGQGRSKFNPGTLAGKACGVLVLSASGSFPKPRLSDTGWPVRGHLKSCKLRPVCGNHVV